MESMVVNSWQAAENACEYFIISVASSFRSTPDTLILSLSRLRVVILKLS